MSCASYASHGHVPRHSPAVGPALRVCTPLSAQSCLKGATRGPRGGGIAKACVARGAHTSLLQSSDSGHTHGDDAHCVRTLTFALTDPSKYLFWITTRAAGTAALVLASLSVGLGLAMATGALKRWGADRRVVHEVLSLSVMAAIAVHAISLLADSYVHASVVDVTVPFVFSYKTLPTSIGIVTGWGLIFLGLSYYARRLIGQRRWRSLHRLTALVWILGLVHAFTEGSDSGQPWFIALIVVTAAPALVLLIARLTRDHRRPRPVAPPQPPRQRERAVAEQYG